VPNTTHYYYQLPTQRLNGMNGLWSKDYYASRLHLLSQHQKSKEGSWHLAQLDVSIFNVNQPRRLYECSVKRTYHLYTLQALTSCQRPRLTDHGGQYVWPLDLTAVSKPKLIISHNCLRIVGVPRQFTDRTPSTILPCTPARRNCPQYQCPLDITAATRLPRAITDRPS